MDMPVLKDRVWLALIFGTLAWMVLFAPFVDRTSLEQIALWLGGSFCLNLAIVSVCVPWIQGPGPVDPTIR